MPDGDIVHGKLPGLYQKPYKWICEGKANKNECVGALMGALMRDLKKKGAAPVVLAKRIGEQLKQAIDNGSQSWGVLSQQLDQIARQAECPHYLKELVLKASKDVLHDFRYGQVRDTSNLSEVIVGRYIQEMYRSRFEQRIPLTSEHHAGVDNAIVMERVEAMRSDVFAGIDKCAKKATEQGDVANLRLPRRQKVKEIDLEEDLT
jgi:hypothetical protein